MVLSQAISFLYNTQLSGISAEKENIKGPLVLNALINYKYSDRLNKIKTMTVTISKQDFNRNKIYFERDVFIPGFEFRGVITGLNDINDTLLAITMSETGWHFTRRLYKIADSLKEYNLTLTDPADLATELQIILDSANTDMPFTWELGDDIPATADYDFNIKWKSYYEVLVTIAKKTGNEIWFEGFKVKFGTRGKTITLDRSDKIYEDLSTKIDLDTYGNIVNVVGAKVGGTNVHAQATADQTNLLYNYERVVSNNDLEDQAAVDAIAPVSLKDFDSIDPDVKIDIEEELVHKYSMEAGDVLKITTNSETQTVKGFYRVISIDVTSSKSTIKLQFSKTGKFIPRISDNIDILEAILVKIHDLELNS